MRSTEINQRAIDLHQEARHFGQIGNYPEAINKLNEAIGIQPDWAYPYYDLAFTYLLNNDSAKALSFYKKTDELEPKGFFTTKTAIYTLEGENAGSFPQGLYLYFLGIEWAESNEKKFEIAKSIVEKAPDYAPAWKEISSLLEDDSERLKAIENGLSLDCDDETIGNLLINKALILDRQGENVESVRILKELISSDNCTTANLAIAKLVLESVEK